MDAVETEAPFEGREEIESRIGEIKTELAAIDSQFAGKFMDPASEEGKRYNDLNNEFEDKKKLHAQLLKRYLRAQEVLATKPGAVEDEPRSFQTARPSAIRTEDIWDLSGYRTRANNPDHLGELYRDGAKRGVESMRFPHRDADEGKTQAHIERLMHTTQERYPGDTARYLLAAGSPTYRRAFSKLLPSLAVPGGTPMLAGLSAEEQRALSLTGASGGFAVPVTLDPTIIPTSNSVVNPARSLARIESISGSNTWNGVSSGAITAARVAEATVGSDNAPTLAQPTVTVTKAHATIPYSYEIIEDWTSMEAEIAKLLQDAKDDEEGTAFVTGAGTTVNPQGFVTGTTNTVAAASGLTITAANIRALEAALPPRFRPREQFVANRGIYNIVAGIDTAGGAALWLYISQGLTTDAPNGGNTGATLLGRTAWEASAMQATVVNATKIMIVGDFNYFIIVDRIGMQIINVPVLFNAATPTLPVGMGAFYAFWRNSSKVLSANAFVALTGTT